jgi:hypothetical protein
MTFVVSGFGFLQKCCKSIYFFKKHKHFKKNSRKTAILNPPGF